MNIIKMVETNLKENSSQNFKETFIIYYTLVFVFI